MASTKLLRLCCGHVVSSWPGRVDYWCPTCKGWHPTEKDED